MLPNLYLKRITISLLFITSLKFSNAQLPETVSVSRQSFINQIRSLTTDPYGNIYYTGVFKGVLTINGDTILFGMGGNDFFLVKESPSGQIIWAKNFGSERDESSYPSLLATESSIYISFSITSPITIDNIGIEVMPNVIQTGCLVKMDSSGSTLWAKRFNYPFSRIYPYNENIMIEAGLFSPPPQILMDNQLVFTPTTSVNSIFLILNKNGEFIDCKSISQNTTANDVLLVKTLQDLSRNRFYFLIATSATGMQSGNNKLIINGTTLTLPNYSAHLMVKTDSQFNLIAHKFITNSPATLFTGNFDESRLRFSPDSTSLNIPVSAGVYSIDGFNENLAGKAAIAVLDTNLVTQKVTTINQNPLQNGSYRLKTDHVIEYENHYYYIATMVGNNQSPKLIDFPKQIFSIQIANNYTEDFDINESSKVYLIKTDKSFNKQKVLYLGNTSPYESSSLTFWSIKAQGGKISFINSVDNVWNPWKIDTALNLISGGMKMSADQGDFINRVHYFKNKSVIALGTASGLTAFDTSAANIISTNQRKDVFIALLDSNKQLIKYTRLFTSFSGLRIISFKTKNDTVYAYVEYLSPKNSNGFNYYSINNVTKTVPDIYLRLLLKIDQNGNIFVTDFHNTPVGPIFNFDIFDNGDLALLSANSATAITLNGQQFPSTFGYYIARMNSEGKITKAMKFLSGTGNGAVFPRDIIIEPDQETFTQLLLIYFNSNVNEYQLTTVRNGNQHSIKAFSNPLPNSNSQPWFYIPYQVSFNANKFHALAGPFNNSTTGGLTRIGNKYFLNIYNLNSTAQANYNQKILAPPGSTQHTFIISLDSVGNYNSHLTFKGIGQPFIGEFNINTAKGINNHYFVSGYQNKALKFGAISIPHSGEQDGLILKLDTALNMVQYFKAASVYSDFCSDIDFSIDSSYIIAFQSKGNPKVTVGLSETKTSALQAINPMDMENVGYLQFLPLSLSPVDYVYTIKNGSWHDPATWSNGKIPTETDRVIIRHKVQVYQNASCFTLYANAGSDLKIEPNIELKMTGLPPNSQ